MPHGVACTRLTGADEVPDDAPPLVEADALDRVSRIVMGPLGEAPEQEAGVDEPTM